MKYIGTFLAALTISLVFRIPHADAACGSNTNAVRVITRDSEGTLLPGMNVSVYHKNTDPDGNPYLATSAITAGTTDAGGQTGVFCLSNKQSPYAVKVYQKSATFGYFTYWDISENGPLDVANVDVQLGGLQVVLRDAQGTLLKNVVFDVYIQSFDYDGEPIIDVTKLNADKLVASDFNTQAFGTTRAFLNPGHYVIRIHGTGSSYFYLWDQEVNAEEESLVEYHLATMRFVFENGFGKVVKNQAFNIYRQTSDVRGTAIFGDLVGAGLSTKEGGSYDAYLPPGTYAIRVMGTGGTAYKSFGYSIDTEEYKVATFRMSGARIILRGANGDLARTLRYSFATQLKDALGRPIPGTAIVKSKTTGNAGYSDIYVPAGTYYLTIGTQRVAYITVFDRQFTTVDWPRSITFRPTNELTATSPLNNTYFTVKKLGAVRIPSYLGDVDRVSAVYQLNAARWTSRYQVIMTVNKSAIDDLGADRSQLRIAFYSLRTKRWTLVSRASTAYQLSALFRDPGYVTVVVKY